MNLAAVEKTVRERIGLDVASIGAAALPRIVEKRMRQRGLTSIEAYAGVVNGDSSEWSALVSELVVPETWFDRGGVEFFEHLARWVRARLNDSPNGRTIRILSVPCSTGEEPYSLALALDREGVPLSRCIIDGVDLARDHLLRAVNGRYPAFSFREPSADPREKYFREVEPGRWELHSTYREAVRFRPGNLVDPTFLIAEPPYDLILCRNLFIYLTPDARSRALANLDRLLAPDGLLCLTAAEADRLPSGRYVADGLVSLAIFKRSIGDPVGPRSGVIRMSQLAPPTKIERKSDVVSYPTREQPRLETAPAYDPVVEGRRRADAGLLDDALAYCSRAIGEAPPSASLYSLVGVIHLASGRSDEASEAFRKALYLDPDCSEALTHMMVLCEQRGDPGQAEGLRRRLGRVRKGAAT